MGYRAILFDLDGTLLNTLEDLRDAVNYALTVHGYPKRTLEETRRFVGNGMAKLIERAVPAGAEPGPVLDTFLLYYQAHSMDKTRPYNGVGALLDSLKARGLSMAIVTNKAHAAALPLCGKFFPQVDTVVGAREGLKTKPHPDMVRFAMEALGARAEETVYIGDSEVDLATAQNAGLDYVCVTWGFRSRAELEAHGAARFAATPEELLTLLS